MQIMANGEEESQTERPTTMTQYKVLHMTTPRKKPTLNAEWRKKVIA